MIRCAIHHEDEQEATDGLLCRAHGQRMRDHLGEREGLGEAGREHHGLPWMWEHLAVAYPSLSVGMGSGGGGGVEDPEAERLAAVIALRADLRDWLGATCAELAERLGMTGPSGITVSTDYRVRHIGTDWDVVSRSARWLLAQVEPLLAGSGIGDEEVAGEAVRLLLEQADHLATRAHALAPWRPQPTAIEGIPCRCAAVGHIHDHGDMRVCWACGRKFDDEQWDVLVKVLDRRYTLPVAQARGVTQHEVRRMVHLGRIDRAEMVGEA